ncbi:DUF1353 domain-containing protein [Halomonas alkaliantarctica]|nr:DUF1353 domain-containing protein [Halomonas alkaliantarctica]
MPRFHTLPHVRWAGGSYPWEITTALVYESDILRRLGLPKEDPGMLRIRAGYRTDYASVPRLPIIYWLTGGRAVMESIVHDYLYDCWTDQISRRTADRIFLEALRSRRPLPAAVHAPWRERLRARWRILHHAAIGITMYTGIRLGGWRGWRHDSTHKCLCCRGEGEQRK